jgi:CheY-like chemotaxis protein
MNELRITVGCRRHQWVRPSVFVICQVLLLWGASTAAAGRAAGPAANLPRAAAGPGGIRPDWAFAPDGPEMAPTGVLMALAAASSVMACLARRWRTARREAEADSRSRCDRALNNSPLTAHDDIPGCSRIDTALSNACSKRGLAALATQVEQRAGGAPDHSPARVLVADDNAANRKAAVHMLESLGLRADVSANGRQAVEMLRLLPYDLVLMDCQMPFRNGQEAAIEIRQGEPPDRRTPIVAMTAESGADSLDDCLASGMDDILLKPVRREKLRATLHRWLPAGGERQLPVTASSADIMKGHGTRV